MKFVISYRYTGEDLVELRNQLEKIKAVLELNGHELFYSMLKDDYFKENHFSNRQILEDFLSYIHDADFHLVLVKSAEKSEGMLIEVGYSRALKKPLILFIQRDVRTVFLRELAVAVIEFDTVSSLMEQLKTFSFSLVRG